MNWQRADGLLTALPFGLRRIDALRTLTTEALARLLNISDNQLSYITNVDFGRGLIKCGSAIVPFMDNFPKNKLYHLMSTKFSEL